MTPIKQRLHDIWLGAMWAADSREKAYGGFIQAVRKNFDVDQHITHVAWYHRFAHNIMIDTLAQAIEAKNANAPVHQD